MACGAGAVTRRQFFKISAIAAVSDAWHWTNNGEHNARIQDQQEKVVITRQYTIETSHGSLAVEAEQPPSFAKMALSSWRKR